MFLCVYNQLVVLFFIFFDVSLNIVSALLVLQMSCVGAKDTKMALENRNCIEIIIK